jgi:arylformamidase
MKALPFSNLPRQASINLRADAYGETAIRLSRLAAMTTRCSLDVPYGPGKSQRLDLYMPKAKVKDLPVYINIHGGGWIYGYKEWMGLNAPPIVAAGALYISLDYSLAPGAKHPTQFADCMAALVWVYRNISRFGGDPNRIHIGGHSAGGHLSALVTLRRDVQRQAGLPPGVIKACLPTSGAYDLADLAIYGQPASASPGDALFSSPKDAIEASPMNWLKDNDTPFFVTWAENDNLLCKAEGPAFMARLREQPGRSEGHMFPMFDHFWIHLDQQYSGNLWTRTLLAMMAGDPRTVALPKA